MTPGGMPVMARMGAPLLAESLARPIFAALFYRRSFASKPTKTTEGISTAKKIRQVKPLRKKNVMSRAQMLHIENNMLFGKLLETSKEKLRRIKKEAKNGGETLPLQLSNSDKPEEDSSYEWELKRTQEFHPERVKVRYSEPSTTEFPKSLKISKIPSPKIEKKVFSNDVLANMSSDLPKDHLKPPLENPQPFDPKDDEIIRIVSPTIPLSLPQPVKNSQPKLPSVTRILGDTMPLEQKAFLERWEKKMREKLGDEGFRLYREGILNNGRDLHENIREILSGTPEDHLFIPERIEGHWRSLRSILASMKQVHALESHVVHPTLEYCGIVDCIAQFRDKLVLVDWKTSEKPKPVVGMTYDAPFQIAAYIGAVNEDPNYSIKIREGLIVVAYQNGNFCETFFLTENDVKLAWDKWMIRLNQYRQQQQKLEKPQVQETNEEVDI